MKKRYILYMSTIFSAMFLWPVSNALAEDKSPVVQQTADPAIILFCLLIFTLAVLVFGLLKNNSKLNSIDQAEPGGAEWINKHLNDLETQQLDKLINRRHPVENEGNN